MIGRGRLALLAGVAFATLAAVPSLGAEMGSARGPLAKAEPGLVAALEDGRSATLWVYLSEQAELEGGATDSDRAAVGLRVYDRLTATATRSQAGLRAMLDATGAEYKSFWIANALKVTGDAELLERIVARPEVAQVTADRTYELPDPPSADDGANVGPYIVTIDPPSSGAGMNDAAGALFGPEPTPQGIAGDVVLANDGSTSPTAACEPLTGFPTGAVALVDRGGCTFVTKARHAQNAGAVAVVVANDVPEDPGPMQDDGTGSDITIPAVLVSLADGDAIKDGLPATGRVHRDPVAWSIERVNAPDVWSQFGVRGEAIVVGAIDSGALFTHPALVEHYRGNRHDGSFDHDYSWFDPVRICGDPSPEPCDNNGHGTHVTGTMVGDDGGENQIGVAPRARWIAAKGCETNSCSQEALLGAAQFMLAPTDVNGQDPRPELRPHVVNNSWGSNFSDPWFRPTVQAWVAAGIWPQFAVGNANFVSCGDASNPGNLPESYAAGAFDIDNAIASFSKRGPSVFGGEVKPNIAAPGVNIRSSWNNGSYVTISGTSMASPHVAGAVALLWSLSPALERDIAATRALLDQTAIDTSDLSCGGTAERNNVWGEGRLDVLAAASQAPVTAVGRLEGKVTDAGTGAPISRATLEIVGPVTRKIATGPDGKYEIPRLTAGSYQITARGFGYVAQTESATIAESETTTLDLALAQAARHPVAGHVRDTNGRPVANATVTIASTPLQPAKTDASGAYSFDGVPGGTYSATAAGGGCYDAEAQELVVSEPTTRDFTLPQRSDSYGYTCRLETEDFAQGDTLLPLVGGESSAITVAFPFNFMFYGQTYKKARICANGMLEFVGPPQSRCVNNSLDSPFGPIPSPDRPNGAIYAFWEQVWVGAPLDFGEIWQGVHGTFPNRRFVIEWRDATFFCALCPLDNRRLDFNIVLHENGEIETQYRKIGSTARERGSFATHGLENADGTVAFQYSSHQPMLDAETTIHYLPPPLPTLTISNVSLVEGNAGPTTFEFTVSKSIADSEATVEFATAGGSATEPGDYARVSGAVEFPAGEATKTITVLVNGDTTFEADETFTVDLASPTGATISDGEGVGTIENDDPAPTLAISNVSQAEGNVGATEFVFTVTKSPIDSAAAVDFATAGGTATAVEDFAAVSGTLEFATGERTKTITVLVNGDTTVETNETVLLNLLNARAATIADGDGLGTIQNDDSAAPPPTLPPLPPGPPARPPAVMRCVVPNVKGRTIARARRMLGARRCALGRTTHAYSATVRSGRIISQSRRPGARLRRGTRVNVVASRGKRPPARR